ncbi:response regulator transcription factor [Atopobium fossor]|uniref:response regulator transcription factor n=1 Tax=Atopobium fossor TaxID=39487 RepID=UPI0004062392|nr:response regulator transcription factor [Atopobium fossor]
MIFYLEDDQQIRDLALYALERTGHEVRGFSRATELYEALKTTIPNLILLDVMLPEEDGVSVLKHVRADQATQDIPVMMLTAKSTEYDKVKGLDAGADDYLTKPFGMMELVSRVGALLRRDERARRHARTKAQFLELGSIKLDPERYEVCVAGKEVRLTHKEFELLRYLLEKRGYVLTRTQMLEHVWGYRDGYETRTVDAHILTLRKKIADIDPTAAECIETVHGVGYRAQGR